ncbi:putative endomembrane protein 70-like protein [Rosellinia necatrix]|uniref:Putative endomembrane protein 70-like protein n=1 Tax=Rosellinia necatrix TaxID=77044 RepID=A0A1S8A709_ROSNE|nr:putative endomembrane protein 70-like protein [Rosellinia necatrix]
MVAHHLQPQPLALLSITGIPTFRHSFFNSSTLISSELPTESRVQKCLEGPLCVGTRPEGDLTIFDPASLTESGTKRLTYERPEPAQNILEYDAKNPRKGLYSYLMYKNAFVPLLESIDLGYEWAKTNPQGSKLAQWPATVFIQGDNDHDVNADVTIQVARDLGQGKARLIIAEGQGHLFEATSFLKDTGVGMDAVRRAIKELDEVLSHHHKG